MRVYYLILRAAPTADNPDVDALERGMARFWVRDKSPESAIDRAKHYLSSYEWTFESVLHEPIETSLRDYPPLGYPPDPDLMNFQKAQRSGVALHLVALARPGVLEPDTVVVRQL
ncbi:MAG: hypothetical protein ABSC19_15170 [Syntrophorhabdales bacterium]|jgi:hypothetical protein